MRALKVLSYAFVNSHKSLEAIGTIQAAPIHKHHAQLVATPMPKLS